MLSQIDSMAEKSTKTLENVWSNGKGVLTRNKALVNFFVAGTAGGMAGVVAGQPFDTIKVKMQTQKKVYTVYPYNIHPRYRNARHCFGNTVKKNGVFGLYRGMMSPLLGVGVQKAMAFGVNDTVKVLLQGENKHKPLSVSQLLLAASAGGVANSLILCPVDQLKICMQVQRGGDVLTLRGAAITLAKAQANLEKTKLLRPTFYFKGLYGGYSAVLMREIPGYSIYFLTYEMLSRARRAWDLPIYTQSLVGGFAGSIMWGVYYPLDMIKSKVQASVASPHKYKNGDVLDTVRRIYNNPTGRRPGLQNFYTGVAPAILRAFPTHAVVFTVYEAVNSFLDTGSNKSR